MKGGFLLFVASLASVLGPENGVSAAKADVTCPSGRSHSEQVVTPDEGERSDVHVAASGLNFALSWVEDSQVKLAFQQDSVEFGSANVHSVSDLNDTECEEPRVVILASNKLVSTFTCDGVAYSRSLNLASEEWDETQVIFNTTAGNSSAPTDEEEEDDGADKIDADSAILVTQDMEDGEMFFCASLANDSASVKCAVLLSNDTEGGNATWQEVDTTSFNEQLAVEQEEEDSELVFTAASDEEGNILFVYVVNSTRFGTASLESGELVPISSELQELNATEDVEIDQDSISLSSNGVNSFVLVISLGEKGIYATSTKDFGETWSELVKLSSKEASAVSIAYTNQFVVAYEDDEGIHGFTFTNETLSGNNGTDNSTIPEEPSNSTYDEDPNNNPTFEEPETVLLLQGASEPVLVGSQLGTAGYLLAGISDDSRVVAIGCYSTPRPTTAPSEEEEPTFSPSTNETTSPPPTDDNETTVSPSLSPSVAPSESSFTQSPSTVNSTIDFPPPDAATSGATSLSEQGWMGLGAALAVLSLSWVVM